MRRHSSESEAGTSGSPDDVTEPVVSVVTATRNRPVKLVRCLESIRTQSFEWFESIVIDDGSTPDHLAEYEAIQTQFDRRFSLPVNPAVHPPIRRVYAQRPSSGPSATRNRGIRRARGEFVAFCDDDDWWLAADHLEVAVKVLREADADLIFANMSGWREGELEIPDWFPDSPWLIAGKRVLDSPIVFEVSLADMMRAVRHHYPHPNGMVFRRELLERVGLFWESLRNAEDINLVLRAADAAKRILFRPDPVAAFDVTPGPSNYRSTPRINHALMMTLSADHALAHCERRETRRCAASISAWTQRTAALELRRQGRNRAALSLAIRALGTWPTFGGLWFLIKSLTPDTSSTQ